MNQSGFHFECHNGFERCSTIIRPTSSPLENIGIRTHCFLGNSFFFPAGF